MIFIRAGCCIYCIYLEGFVLGGRYYSESGRMGCTRHIFSGLHSFDTSAMAIRRLALGRTSKRDNETETCFRFQTPSTVSHQFSLDNDCSFKKIPEQLN